MHIRYKYFVEFLGTVDIMDANQYRQPVTLAAMINNVEHKENAEFVQVISNEKITYGRQYECLFRKIIT